MIMDKLTEFCDAVALNTGAAGTYNLGDVIDTQHTGRIEDGKGLGSLRDLGQGNPIYLVVSMQTTATSGGSATLAIQLVSDAVSTPDTATATKHFVSDAIAVADLGAGRSIAVVALPMEGQTYERYLGIQQVTGTAAFTAGAIDAFLTMNPAVWKAYPDAQNSV